MTKPAAAPGPPASPWIFGPKTDLLIGCGAWSLPLLALTFYLSQRDAAQSQRDQRRTARDAFEAQAPADLEVCAGLVVPVLVDDARNGLLRHSITAGSPFQEEPVLRVGAAVGDIDD